MAKFQGPNLGPLKTSITTPNQFNIGPLQIKIKEAREKGVPEADINKILQNNAMKARDAKVRGAFIQAGLGGVGKVQSNLAQGIGQAGLNNRSFAPTESALGGLGDAAAARGQADAELAGEESRIARDDQERTDKLAREDANRESYGQSGGVSSQLSKDDYAKMEQLLRQANPHIGGES